MAIDPGERRQYREILAHDLQHARPGQHHGADRGDQQQPEQGAHDGTTASAKHRFRRNVANFDLAGHGGDRRHVQEGEVQQQIEHRNRQCAQHQHRAQGSLWVRQLTGEIGGRVPAGVGVVHVDQGDRKSAAEELRRVTGLRREQHRLRRVHQHPTDDAKHQDERDLQRRERPLQPGAAPARPRVHGRQHHDQADGQKAGIKGREDRGQVGAEGNGGKRNWRGEADGGRDPARHKARGGMIGLGEKVIFAAGSRQRGPQFRVAQRAAECREPAHRPQRKQDEPRLDVLELKAEAGEHAGANHVRDHHGKRRARTEPSDVGHGAARSNTRQCFWVRP